MVADTPDVEAPVDDVIVGYMYLDIPCVPIATVPTGTLTAKYIHTEIVFKEGYVYMYKDYSYTEWFRTKHQESYRKNTGDGFLKNIMDNIIFIFNLQETIVNAMTNSSADFKVVPDRLLKSYKFENNEYAMVLDLPNGLTTDMFRELTLKLRIGTYDDKLYLKGFSGETTMFSIMKATFNFQENGAFGVDPDLSIVDPNIENDTKYALYNE